MAFYGVDLSQWQGEIDFAKLAKKIDFAIIRSVSGKYYDKKAKDYINECYKHNIPYGLYCAAYPLTIKDAEAEAEKIMNYARMCKPLYPIYYDYEGFSREYARKQGVKHTNDDINKITDAFCAKVTANGYLAGIYANLNYIRNVYTDETVSKYSLWLAYWGSKRPIKAPIWQFSNMGHIPGINGRVDKNVCYVDYPKYIKSTGLNGW